MPSKLQLLPKDTSERLKELPLRVATVEGLLALWLFGSQAREEATPISDVDLAYLLDALLDGEALERLEDELYRTISQTLHTDEFAFVNIRRAPAYFASRVLTEGRLLLCCDVNAVAVLAETVYRHAPDAYWLRHVGNEEFLKGFGMPDSPIDKDRVTEFLRLLSEDLRVLREKAQGTKENYIGSPDMQAIVERRLQTAAESCINISNHLIARLALRAPQDYADVFRILSEAQIVPYELAQKMMDMARFRNLLVHVYWTIDHGQLYESLPARLAVLESFAKHIVQWLKERKKA